jgi:hypothetical protein
MLKYLPICAVLAAVGANPASAQQREAILQKVNLSGALFDLVVATQKPKGITFDLGDSPDALLLNLPGGLALGFEREEEMLKTAELLQAPGCALVEGKAGKARMPVVVYVVPKPE